MAEPARRVRVTGRVQGVFFRAWTREQAAELGVNGWVRNAPDGSVEAHLEGDEAAIKALIDRLHTGPSPAQVDRVEVEGVQPEGLGRFDIRH
ncbi:MAG TPA: acylphosphatase [Sphingomicrobium sp.]|nr:acylphosphatase [Sphingomicrobium sp.]